jgi:hypothetical protein
MYFYFCKRNWLSYIAILFIIIIGSHHSFANEMPLDGAPANGIVVRDEKNIQIEREDLYISGDKIEVTYVFRNHSQVDITTEVAFPIPPYSYRPEGHIKYPIHADFTVEVNGVKQQFNELTRALVGGKDYTDQLKSMNISIKDFNQSRWGHGIFHYKFFEQSKAEQKKLLDMGIVEMTEDLGEPYAMPAWQVETTYFWKQVFPAGSSVRIRHSYTPILSYTNNPSEDKLFVNRNRAINPNNASLPEILCLNAELKKWESKKTRMFVAIVDYILTTANHWKKPIKQFHLILETDQRREHNQRVSTCFERNRLKKINDYRYELTINDFEPKDEIGVYFMSYYDEAVQLTPAEILLNQNATTMIGYFKDKKYEGHERLYVADDILYQRSSMGDRFLIIDDNIKRLNAKVLRNEIFAHHGRIFSTPEMKKIFEGVSWYKPRPEFSESELNDIEKKNVDFIREFETKNGWK